MNNEFEQIINDFEFLEDWEDKYRYLIEEGKKMPALDEALKVDSNKVNGCASQVWLHFSIWGAVWGSFWIHFVQLWRLSGAKAVPA